MCVEGLGLWSKPPEILEPIYRLVEHGAAKSRLTSPHARDIDPAIADIARIFVTLQQHRHDADYRAPGQVRYSRKQALGLVASAEDAVDLVEALTPDARLSLAILLIGSRRAT